ncbi:MAG: TipC family immunity protein [Clostridia bacterium]|nr:TipC family immunity protein [Clostridia bacterium]
MNQGWKKRFVVFLIFLLVAGVFIGVRSILIKNIFDEMYFGTEDVFGGHLTTASWTNMKGMAKNGDAVKYAVPGRIRIGFSKSTLGDDESFQIIWETEEKQLELIYSVALFESNHVASAVLNIHYSPYQKRLEVYPLRIVSSQNIYGDTSEDAIDDFFEKYGSSETAYYERFTNVFETVLIENWRTGNPDTLFRDTLGQFEMVHVQEKNDELQR